MIDINELKTALAQIEQEKKDVEIILQNQLKQESDVRRVTALDYISTLDFTLKGSTTPEKKQSVILSWISVRVRFKRQPMGN